MSADSERRLAVILHADVIESTALVRRDETLAHNRILNAFRLLSQSIEAYSGATRELRGDALVGEFNRASDAICAAVAFHEKNIAYNAELEDEIQPCLRIGIAMGEVVVGEQMMTGAGVVLAQRLEQLAERDGICLQGAAYDTLPENLPFQYEHRGEQLLKGFDEPVRTFAVFRKAGESMPAPEIKPPTLIAFKNVTDKFPPPIAGSSIAVLPFVNLSDNPEQDYFCHGVSSEIHTDLTRFRDLFVSGRSSCLAVNDQFSDVTEIANKLGVQYLVRGGIRSDRDRVRINVELVEAETGGVLWSERYERILEDIFEVETEVANTIAATLSIKIEDAVYERRKECPPERLSAYDWYLRGNRSLELGGPENLAKAKREYRQALEIDPEYSSANAGLSIVYAYEMGEMLAPDFSESLDLHHKFAEKAVALDSTDSRGHYAMCCVLQYLGQFELADSHAERSVELNPSEYHNICARGYTLMNLNRADESAASFNQSLRRNPLAPNACLLAMGLIEYQEKNYAQSTATIARMTPSYIQRLSTLAAGYAQLGYDEEARLIAREFWNQIESRPGRPATGDTAGWRRYWRQEHPWGDEEAFENLLEGFGKAGLPV